MDNREIAKELIKMAKILVSTPYYIHEVGQDKINRLIWAIKSHSRISFDYKSKSGNVSRIDGLPTKLVKNNTMLIINSSSGKQMFLYVDSINPIDEEEGGGVVLMTPRFNLQESKDCEYKVYRSTWFVQYDPLKRNGLKTDYGYFMAYGYVDADIMFDVTLNDIPKEVHYGDVMALKVWYKNLDTGEVGSDKLGWFRDMDDLREQYKEQYLLLCGEARKNYSRKIDSIKMIVSEMDEIVNESDDKEETERKIRSFVKDVYGDFDIVKAWENFKHTISNK